MNANPSWTERAKALEASVVEVSTLVPVSAGPGILAKELARHLPELHFRRTLCRGGWYRLGGVLAADGSRISDDLESWAEMTLAACDGDFDALRDEYAGTGLIATRRVGRTHYFVAPTGEKSADFLQLEIEDLQETQAHTLFAQTPAPTAIDELIDPDLGHHNGQPVGLPYYTFRRLTHIGDLLARLRQADPPRRNPFIVSRTTGANPVPGTPLLSATSGSSPFASTWTASSRTSSVPNRFPRSMANHQPSAPAKEPASWPFMMPSCPSIEQLAIPSPGTSTC